MHQLWYLLFPEIEYFPKNNPTVPKRFFYSTIISFRSYIQKYSEQWAIVNHTFYYLTEFVIYATALFNSQSKETRKENSNSLRCNLKKDKHCLKSSTYQQMILVLLFLLMGTNIFSNHRQDFMYWKSWEEFGNYFMFSLSAPCHWEILFTTWLQKQDTGFLENGTIVWFRHQI